MRTTLDLHPRVLAAARARVSERQNKSLGEAVSELALTGLERVQSGRPLPRHGLMLLPSPEDHVITDDMVAEALRDE